MSELAKKTWRDKLQSGKAKAPRAMLAIASVAVAALMFESQLFFILPWPVWINIDEPYITAFAWRMVEGSWLPYVDAVSHRGPVLYWAAALFVKIFGPNWFAIRMLGMTTFLATTAGSLYAGWRSKRPLSGIFGVLVYAWAALVFFEPHDGASFNGEPMLNAFALCSFALLTSALALDSPSLSPRKLFFAGALASCALLSKQVGGVLVVPFTIWVFAAAVNRGPFWKTMLFFALGGVTPVLLTVLRFAIAGELSTFWYYFIVYNRDVYMAPFGSNAPLAFRTWMRNHHEFFAVGGILTLAWFARFVAGATSFKAAARRYDAAGFELTVFLSLLVSALMANASLRGFGHYFLQLMPWAGLALGLLAHHIVGRLNGWNGAFAVAMVFLPPFVFVNNAWQQKEMIISAEQAKGRGWEENSELPLCEFLDDILEPEDRIFVWGFRPSVYVNCQRFPPSRYVFTTFPSGAVPWNNTATPEVMAARVVPGSQEILLAELEAAKPKVIVDAAMTMMNKSIIVVPALKAYVEQHYCMGPEVMAPLWLRKFPDGSCPGEPRAEPAATP